MRLLVEANLQNTLGFVGYQLILQRKNTFKRWCNKLEHRIEVILEWIKRDRSR